jgi:rhodanese-related sulfurtransferase
MKNISNYFAVFASLFFVAIILKSVFAQNLPTISPSDALKLSVENKAIIVDVREVEEIMSGKIKGSKEIPLSLMTSDKIRFEKELELLPKDKEILVYCRSGRRSGIVGAKLKEQGYNVKNLGGFTDWEKAGLPTEKASCFATKC